MQKKDKKPVVILGISAFNHDSSSAIIKGDELIAFSEEERFNEQKNTGNLPIQSIGYCLEKANLNITDVTDIVFYFDIKLSIKSYLKNNNPFSWLKNPEVFKSYRFIYEFIWLMNFTLKARRIPNQLNAINAKMHYVSHHTSHIWYGLFSANKKDGIVISNDSVGEEISSIAEKWEINDKGTVTTKILFKQDSPHSIGYLYGAISEYLGFSRKNGSGKVMGLASYGNESEIDYFLQKIILHKDGTYSFKEGLVKNRSYKPAADRLSTQLLKKFEFFNKKHSQNNLDLAKAVQVLTETILTHQIETVSSKTKNIVLTGGVAQNSVANGIVSSKFLNNNIIVPPIPHDAGCSIGAAIFHYHTLFNKLPKYIDASTLGSSFSDDEVETFLKTRKISYRKLDSLDECVAVVKSKLLNNDTIGIFRNSMECGPRALGNRTILALPSLSNITNYLNSKVKYREWFRPYGVIVCQSKLHEYFDVPMSINSIPHMTHVFDVNKKYRELFRGVIHTDNTCRIQTTNNDDFLKKLFDELESEKLTRSVINTSLNVMGKPICRTPSQAISCLFTSGMDSMIFNERFLVEKKW